MKALSPEISALLDKLYNLRGDDSSILVDMDKQKNKAEETKMRTTEEKKELQEKIADLEKQHEELEEQGEKLVDVLSRIHRDEYATVLDRLKIDFDPMALVAKINKALPRTIDSVTVDTQKAAEKLVKVEEEMNTAIMTIEELGIRRDSALANQEKLNQYFDLALAGRIDITRDSITSLLEQLGFNEKEQREAAKLLMFPEDALYFYEEKRKEKERSGKSISEVIAEAKNADAIAQETIKIEEEPPTSVEFAVQDDDKATLMSIFETYDIDYTDFTAQELDNLLEHFDEDRIRHNIEFIKKATIGTDIFVNHANLMLDSELQEKVKVLLDLGKEPIDIYLNPTVLEKYSKEELENAIRDLKNNGMDPKNVPLMAY